MSTSARQALILTKMSLKTVKVGQLGCHKIQKSQDKLCNYNTVGSTEKQTTEQTK